MPILPVHDDNPLRLIRFQIVTAALIAANVLVYLWQLTLGEEGAWDLWLSYGLIPAVLTGEASLSAAYEKIPAWATLVTTMFLHGGYWHLGGNMLFLWVFGDNVEDATGHWRFPVLYLAGGVIAGLVEVVVDPSGRVPVVGASGAIAGVLGAYLVLHPRRSLLILVARSIPVRLNVGLVLVLWVLIQIGGGVIFGGDFDNDIAWWAHVGGFAAGMALIVPLRRRGVPLFDGRPLDLSVFYRRLKTSRNGDRKGDGDTT